MFLTQNRIMTKVEPSHHAYRSRENGFSLVELMVTMAILLIFSTVIVNVFSSSTRTYTVQEAGVEASQSVRAAMDYMVKEIRHAGYDPTVSGIPGLITSGDSQIFFTADYDENGTINGADESTTFQLNGDTVEMIDGTGVVYPLVNNVTDLTFEYLSTGNGGMALPIGLSDMGLIQAVRISLTVQQPAGRAAPVTRTLSTEAMCRNLWFKG